MARNGIIALGLFFSIQSAAADNVELGNRIVVQPDGTSFILREHVDEFEHYLVADAGYVVHNQNTGYYYYARYDTVGHKAPTSLRVGRDDESIDTWRLAYVNEVMLRVLIWTSRGWNKNEDMEPLSHPSAELCANGIIVPEPQDNLGLVKDCEVLLAVRDSLAGIGHLNWSADIPISDWVGVTVSNGRVTELDLGGKLLMGTISPRLAQLSELKGLFLYGNALMGMIPPELGQLIHLEHLNLIGNALTGPIPPELGQLTQLRTLGLEFNELTGAIPPELAQLSELKELHLGYNALTGPIPPELGQLSHLNGLSLDDNDLTGTIPPELGQLVHLERLSLSGNALTGTIPPELGRLLQLENLSLNDNALTGTIPPELTRLTKLVRLNLDTNHLTGATPPELGQLSQLEDFWLGDNALTGTIPPELGQLTQLSMLSLHNNELTGTIPPELAKLRKLKVLILGHNALIGAILPELGQLIHLEGLYLQNNALTGPIPPELGQLTVLENLSLNDNELTGAIPPELAALTELKYLHLSDNQLTGSIPPNLGQLTGILLFNLRNNQLTGTFPPELGQLTRLRGLWLDGNTLTGCIPGGLANWTDDLPRCPAQPNLCTNGIAVPEPQSNPGLVKDCKVLLGVRDRLAGDVFLNWSAYTPIAHWEGISIRDARVTALSLGYGDDIDYYDDYYGKPFEPLRLTGLIPPELGQLTELEYLSLNDNALTGPIPPELGQLTKLKELDLYCNRLSGPIPPELGQLTKLRTLNLYRNRLTCVPEALAKWADYLPLCPDIPSASDETATSVAVASQNLPTTSGLAPNFPNPFNASTQIAYDIATPGPVQITIYNTLGQPVRTLVNQFQTAGFYQVRWDARDQRGTALAAGVYLVRLHYPGGEQTRRLLLLK